MLPLNHPLLYAVRTVLIVLMACCALWSVIHAVRADLARPRRDWPVSLTLSALTLVMWWVVLSLAWVARWQ